ERLLIVSIPRNQCLAHFATLEKKRAATSRIKSVVPRASVAQYRHTSPTRSLRWPPQAGCVQGTSRRISHRRHRGLCIFLQSYGFIQASPTHDYGVCASVASRAPHASPTPSSVLLWALVCKDAAQWSQDSSMTWGKDASFWVEHSRAS